MRYGIRPWEMEDLTAGEWEQIVGHLEALRREAARGTHA